MNPVHVNAEALAKAKEILKRQEDTQICIEAGICPSCGEKLRYELGTYSGYNWNSFYKCASCRLKLSELGNRIE